MINKIGVEDNRTSVNSKALTRSQQEGMQNPNFKGLGAFALGGIQACERMPMVNVAVVDMLSAILPRTVVESMTNWFAGFEAFRRESSGLLVNCMIPSVITLGIAKLLNPAFMPTGINMSRSWADGELITKIASSYSNTSSKDKAEGTIEHIIQNIHGYDGSNSVHFGEILGNDLNKYAKELAEISREDISHSKMNKKVGKIAKEIIDRTHVAENITVDSVKTTGVKSMLTDTVKFLHEFQKCGEKADLTEFSRKARYMVKTKSILGLMVVLPLAASMQYINRWITGKVSGTKGAPIYDDFAKGNNIEENPAAKEGLLKQKIISISSMIGVGLLSMMKIPSMKMLEFKGIFPTMDQARIISTTTFASRMAAADDKNELAESTIRDIATFCGLYFFGDYAAKGMATFMQKKTGVSLLNETKPLKENANIAERFIHWVKDVNIKSSDELVSKTKELLKGAKPTEKQAKLIEKELKRATNLRAGCQATNIGVSLALLGIIIPIFTRRNTKKKHEKMLKIAQQNEQAKTEQQKEPITPLNVEYSKLTKGFRAGK